MFLSYREAMRHKEIKLLAQCPGSLWSFWLQQSKGYFCWVEGHTQEASYHQLLWLWSRGQGWA